MPNEIATGADSALVLYAHVYRFSDKAIYDVGDSAYEAIGTWNDARAAECDIAMTAVGDVHFADFPASARGVYFVLIKIRATAVPLASDKEKGQGVMFWDGAKEVNIYTEMNSWFKNG